MTDRETERLQCLINLSIPRVKIISTATDHQAVELHIHMVLVDQLKDSQVDLVVWADHIQVDLELADHSQVDLVVQVDHIQDDLQLADHSPVDLVGDSTVGQEVVGILAEVESQAEITSHLRTVTTSDL